MATKRTKVTTVKAEAKAVKIRDVDPMLWRNVKRAALDSGVPVRQYVIETLARAVAGERKG